MNRSTGLHESDGGHTFTDGVVFPIEDQRDEHALIAEPQPEAPDPFWFGLVAVARLLPFAFVAVALGTFFILEVLKGKP